MKPARPLLNQALRMASPISMARFVLAALALVAPGGTGCSVLLVKPPPRPAPEAGPLACTSDRTAPAIDVALAAVTGLYALDSGPSEFDRDGRSRDTGVRLAMAGVALGAAASAFYGFGRVGECRTLENERQVRRFQALTGAGAPPPSGSVPYVPALAARDPWLGAGPPPGGYVVPDPPAAPEAVKP